MSSYVVIVPISPVFRHFAISSTALAIKMSAMSYLTSKKKTQKSVMTNPEDGSLGGEGHVDLYDEDVLRIQRAHRNDVENISIFFVVGAFYVVTEPREKFAICCFYGFTIARCFHSLCYVNGVNKGRTRSYKIGTVINAVMMISVIDHFLFNNFLSNICK